MTGSSTSKTTLTKSTVTPSKHQPIPEVALESLQRRLNLGVVNYKDRDCFWDTASPNQEILDRTDWVIQRLRHVISHAALAIAKLQDPRLDDGDDDAGAIMWGGAMLAARRARKATLQAQQEPLA